MLSIVRTPSTPAFKQAFNAALPFHAGHGSNPTPSLLLRSLSARVLPSLVTTSHSVFQFPPTPLVSFATPPTVPKRSIQPSVQKKRRVNLRLSFAPSIMAAADDLANAFRAFGLRDTKQLKSVRGRVATPHPATTRAEWLAKRV